MACTQSRVDRTIVYQLGTTYSKADSIKGERLGGGQFTYIIQRSADQTQLNISITRETYQDLSKAFSMTQADLDPATWQTIQGLFDGTSNLGGVIYGESLPTGSWFYGYSMLNGVSIQIANAQTRSQLASFGNRVMTHP
jgi:hypothetical protein